MNSLQSIQEKIQKAGPLDFSDIITDAIELFKKVWLKGFLMVLIIMAFSLVLTMLISLIGLGPDPFLFNDGFNLDKVLNYMSANALYSIPQTIIVSSITIALLGGFYRICKETEAGGNVKDDYFYFFKQEYLGKIFVLGVIHALIATIAQMLFFIPYIYVYVPLAFFSIVFANNPDLTEMEIVKASFSLGNKKWLISFGTMIVTFIMGALGVLACGIGLLFTISIAYLPAYLIYKGVIGFDQRDEIDMIGEESL